MSYSYHKVSKDGNQSLIIQFIKSHGAEIINCTPLKNAFDLLVLYQGNIYICEVKQPKGKLSDGELKCKAMVERSGNKYWILRTTDDALEMLQSINS